MNVKRTSTFLWGKREKLREHMEIMLLCNKGQHHVEPDQYHCSRCKEQVIKMPEWLVTLSDFRGEVEQAIIEAPNAETALYDILADEPQFLVKGKTYGVKECYTQQVTDVLIDDEAFEVIFSIHEYRMSKRKNKADEKIKSCLIKLPFLVLVILFCHYVVAGVSTYLSGFLEILAVSLYVTLIFYDFYLIDEDFKSRE